MATLYELTDDFMSVLQMLEDEDCDKQCVLDTLESLEYDIEDKADGYAKIIKTLKYNIDAVDAEIKRLTERKKALDNKINWLKSNLENTMRIIGKMKFSTDLFSFNIQKNGGKRKLVIDVPIDDVPEMYRIKQPDAVDGEKVREYLKQEGLEGADGSLNCDWCHLEPQGESLRIR